MPIIMTFFHKNFSRYNLMELYWKTHVPKSVKQGIQLSLTCLIG